MLSRGTRNSGTREVDAEIFRLLDQPLRHINDFDLRHGQAENAAEARGEHLVRKHPDVLGIIQNLQT